MKRWLSLVRSVQDVARRRVAPIGRAHGSGTQQTGAHGTDARSGGPPPNFAYPGDFVGLPPMSYSPNPDGRPDPGEIVWTWVPFEEDHAKGKDRPVLVIGRDGDWLLALPLTSKDHDRDAEQERRAGRLWADIGTGQWDSRGRPSEVRVNRIVRVDERIVRREGAVLDRATFEQVTIAVRDAVSRYR